MCAQVTSILDLSTSIVKIRLDAVSAPVLPSPFIRHRFCTIPRNATNFHFRSRSLTLSLWLSRLMKFSTIMRILKVWLIGANWLTNARVIEQIARREIFKEEKYWVFEFVFYAMVSTKNINESFKMRQNKRSSSSDVRACWLWKLIKCEPTTFHDSFTRSQTSWILRNINTYYTVIFTLISFNWNKIFLNTLLITLCAKCNAFEPALKYFSPLLSLSFERDIFERENPLLYFLKWMNSSALSLNFTTIEQVTV